MARIRMILHNDARIGTNAPIQLCGADIDGINPRRAALQQTIGEAARGCADIDGTPCPSHRSEMSQCRISFNPPRLTNGSVAEYLDLSVARQQNDPGFSCF